MELKGFSVCVCVSFYSHESICLIQVFPSDRYIFNFDINENNIIMYINIMRYPFNISFSLVNQEQACRFKSFEFYKDKSGIHVQQVGA
jgi:hypothetical protein